MKWERFGFKDDPLKTTPITKSNLELFTGHVKEIAICQNILSGGNVRIVIEGARGVGTTSFANYLRFSDQVQKSYFTPKTEIKVEQGWRFETLLASIISNIVRELEFLQKNSNILSDKRFQSAKAISVHISETFRSFGMEAFGFGGSYGKQIGNSTQPVIVPSNTLGHHLEDLIAVVKENGFSKGILLQLNNLDIGEIHTHDEMKYLFNCLRDYSQIDGSNWIFVGDIGLRKFIAQNVDRMDDIISYEATIDPISIKDFLKMLDKRVKFYSETNKANLPIEKSVFEYLYNITHGRIRYIFGLIARLMANLHVGDLTNIIDLGIAKPMLMKLGHDRVKRSDITKMEEQILRLLVKLPNVTPSNIAREIGKSSQYAGRVLNNLVSKNLAISSKEGRERSYVPSIDAVIAYTEYTK